MKVTRYEDLMERDHAALMQECAALYPPKRAPKPQRSEADMLAEHEDIMWVTSLNQIDVRGVPF